LYNKHKNLRCYYYH